MDRDLFDSFDSAQSTLGGNYIRDGRGRLIIKKLLFEKKTNGRQLTCEFVVESSHKVAVVSPLSGASLDVEPNSPGSECSSIIPLDNPKVKSGPGNAKAVLLALLGLTDEQYKAMDPDKRKTIVTNMTEGGRAIGMVLDYATYRKLDKAKTKDLVLASYSHVPATAGNSDADIEKRRAALAKVSA